MIKLCICFTSFARDLAGNPLEFQEPNQSVSKGASSVEISIIERTHTDRDRRVICETEAHVTIIYTILSPESSPRMKGDLRKRAEIRFKWMLRFGVELSERCCSQMLQSIINQTHPPMVEPHLAGNVVSDKTRNRTGQPQTTPKGFAGRFAQWRDCLQKRLALEMQVYLPPVGTRHPYMRASFVWRIGRGK